MSKTTNEFVPEGRERTVRTIFDHERDHPSRWAAVVSIAEKIGCVPQTLHEWLKKAEADSGKRVGMSTEVAEKVKALEHEVRELRQANEILRQGARVFAENFGVYCVCKVWRQMMLLPPAGARGADTGQYRGLPTLQTTRDRRHSPVPKIYRR